MGETRIDRWSDEYPYYLEDIKNSTPAERRRSANFGKSTMGQGGAIHFNHRGEQLPTYRHTPRLLNLLNRHMKWNESRTQRQLDEYRRNRDLHGPHESWVKDEIQSGLKAYYESPDRLLNATFYGMGDPLRDDYTKGRTYIQRFIRPEV